MMYIYRERRVYIERVLEQNASATVHEQLVMPLYIFALHYLYVCVYIYIIYIYYIIYILYYLYYIHTFSIFLPLRSNLFIYLLIYSFYLFIYYLFLFTCLFIDLF